MFLCGMIQQLRDVAKGASVAIIGSGATATDYKGKEDLAIAVNGGILNTGPIQYFMAGDRQAATRQWWMSSLDKKSAARILSSYLAPFDQLCYPDEAVRKRLQEQLSTYSLEQVVSAKDLDKASSYVHYVPDCKPEKPHLFFRFGGFGLKYVTRIRPGQEYAFWGGTIAAIALQAALVMGARDIHLYGCTFSNPNGTAYFYDCPCNEQGMINEEQRRIMQATMEKVRDYGRKVLVHGKSRLT